MAKKRVCYAYIPIIAIAAVFCITQSISLLASPDIWWDASVYLGMGKYIYSLGNSGLWEASRPIVWPIILGFFWKLNLDAILFGKIAIILFGAGCIFLAYLASKKIFDSKIAFFAAAFLAFSPTFYLFTTVLQTEIPSLFFVLLGFYLFVEKRYGISGLSFGIAFMARFFIAYAVIPLLLVLIFISFKEKKGFARLLVFSLSFIIPIIPYLILNQLLYNNPLYPFELQAYMTKNTGFVFYQPYYFYLVNLIKENFLVLFSVFGFISIFRKKALPPIMAIMVLMVFLFSFVPFNLTPHKEMRLMLLSLPFLYMIASFGLIKFSELFKKKQKFVLIFLMSMWALQTAPQLKFNSYEDGFDDFYDYVKTAEINEPVWISNPAFVAYSGYKAELIYYPAITNEKLKELNSKMFDANHILMDTCDLVCQPPDSECEKSTAELIKKIKYRFNAVYFKSVGDCERYIFQNK